MPIADEEFEYSGSTFDEVRAVTFSGPYVGLPNHQGLGPKTLVQFFNDSARNMHDKRDIRPRFDKLIHANGICFAGTWNIDKHARRDRPRDRRPVRPVHRNQGRRAPRALYGLFCARALKVFASPGCRWPA